jgi:hypothetical protein
MLFLEYLRMDRNPFEIFGGFEEMPESTYYDMAKLSKLIGFYCKEYLQA